jgi:hypothetical protein
LSRTNCVGCAGDAGIVEYNGEDRCAFILRVVSGEVCNGEATHYVVAELFGSEAFRAPFVDVINCVVEKMFVSVYFHGV